MTQTNTPVNDKPAILRITIALFLAQCFAAAAYTTATSVNNLAFIDLTGSKNLAGLPLTFILAGSAFANFRLGVVAQKFGRRTALTLGCALGAAGAVLAGIGIAMANLWVYVPGMLLLGGGRGLLEQSRYAAAEVYPVSQRARAISIVVWGATIGSVLGSAPWVVVPLMKLAGGYELAEYSGPVLSSAAFYAVAGVALFILLAVDFKGIAQRVAQANPINPNQSKSALPQAKRSFWDVLHVRDARAAAIAMICGQAAMVFAMGVISVHMRDHGHDQFDISAVITVHVLGMFALSPLVGILGDKLGRKPMILLGALLLGFGCIGAALSYETWLIAIAQFMVGFGWSCCYVSGSALLTDALGVAERARLQSTNDAMINIASGAGALSGGILLAQLGFNAVSAIGFTVALIPLLFLGQVSKGQVAKDKRPVTSGK